MLHATMKTFLQRRLQDMVNDGFSSGVLDDLLAVGIAKLLAYIHDINPAAFISTNTFATVSGTDLYAKQASSMRVIRIEIAQAAGGYAKVALANFYDLIDDGVTAFDLANISVADLGNQWYMHPTPDSINTVRVWYVPIITDSTGWDAVATQISPALHFLPVDFAVVEALGETAESASEARSRINDALALIPSLYGRTGEQVASFNMSPFASSGV